MAETRASLVYILMFVVSTSEQKSKDVRESKTGRAVVVNVDAEKSGKNETKVHRTEKTVKRGWETG